MNGPQAGSVVSRAIWLPAIATGSSCLVGNQMQYESASPFDAETRIFHDN